MLLVWVVCSLDVHLLINLNLSNFNTQNVKEMWSMFKECSSLNNLNLSNFDTKNVFNMHHMFEGCISLRKNNVINNDNKIMKLLK